jgi:hypothetical protein
MDRRIHPLPGEPNLSENHSPKDLFVSYAHEAFDLVRPLVARQRRIGCSVWFDLHDTIPAGTVAHNLAAAVDTCAQTLICL